MHTTSTFSAPKRRKRAEISPYNATSAAFMIRMSSDFEFATAIQTGPSIGCAASSFANAVTTHETSPQIPRHTGIDHEESH